MKRLVPFFNISIPLFFLALFTACQADSNIARNLESKAVAFGKINRINILCDKEIWEGPLGDSIRFYYSSAYPILPQPEPIFDLKHFTLEDLKKDPIRKELRTYLILADVSDESSSTTAIVNKDVGKEKIRKAKETEGFGSSVALNKWASGQSLFYIYGNGQEKLTEGIIKSYTAIAKKINKADEKMINATAYFNGENVSLAEEIYAKMKVKMRIPEEYYVTINEDNMMWLRRETSEVSSNILLHRVTYKDQSQLSKAGIKAIRDSLGRKYISSSVENSYMRINDVDLPMFADPIKLNGNYALEARGIWDIVNDFMGGAFVSYLVHNPEKSELLFMDGFVHAPGKKKRDLLQQLEYILHTAKY